jgi:DnaJ-class molecular chaperone
MTTTLTTMTFEEWQRRNPNALDETEDCSICDGEGSHTCECGHEHDCEECNGTGKKVSLRALYNNQKSKDMAKLARWQS